VLDFRRDFLKMAGLTVAGGATTLLNPSLTSSQSQSVATAQKRIYFDVQACGTKGDGTSIDSPAINAAIDAAANAGGGTVIFPAGVYLSYSIHLKSNVALFLQQGATILAASTPYDASRRAGMTQPATSARPSSSVSAPVSVAPNRKRWSAP
jgi:polygalacturonase